MSAATDVGNDQARTHAANETGIFLAKSLIRQNLKCFTISITVLLTKPSRSWG
jgi:hypothetical protein